jgi:hypothetical protein
MILPVSTKHINLGTKSKMVFYSFVHKKMTSIPLETKKNHVLQGKGIFDFSISNSQ